MSEPSQPPAVSYIQGQSPYDSHESLFSPRHIIALIIVLGLVASVFFPYFFTVGEGRSGDMIASGAKVLETVAVLVLGYFFGTTVSSSKKDETIRQQALASPAAAGAAPILVEPPATLKIEDPAHAGSPSADAARPAEEAAAPASPPRSQPGDIRPPE